MPGVYLSYPFCSQKCTYCNFASGVLPAALEPQYLDAIIAESVRHNWQWTPETVYLGGGTPSRMNPDDLCRLLESIPGRPWLEATMEAAPGGITPELAKAWIAAGITRVSLGVQSFVESELRLTGRKHTAAIVSGEIAMLRAAGLDEINVDLIAGLAAQTEASWLESLDWVERLSPPHVSIYMLEVDEDSRLGLEILNNGPRFGAAQVPNDEDTARFYEMAVDRLASLGVHRYEISNFARPGHQSLHNLKYWNLEPYAGFGADAHGFDGRMRVQNTDDVRDYIQRIQSSFSAQVEELPSDPAAERFFVRLRLTGGIEPDPGEWQRHRGTIEQFLADGLLEREGNRLRLTRRGVLLSNEVFQEFL